MIAEYGGCLPQEAHLLQTAAHDGGAERGTAVNSGRGAIYRALSMAGVNHIYLPYYTCPTIQVFLENHGIQVTEYCLGPDFLPEVEAIEEDALLLWTNYFGCMKEETIRAAVSRYGNRLILDHCQAFFDQPAGSGYDVYSVRKFIGVSSGAYVLGPVQERELPPLPETHYSGEFLRVAREAGSNAAYALYCQNEDAFLDSYGKMPEDVRSFLHRVDYGVIQAIRKRNFEIMHQILGPYNGLDLDFSGRTPFMYPLYTETPGLREALLREQIFCPTWWRRVLQLRETNDFEKSLASHLVPLAIDQRYTPEDVFEVAERVRSKIRMG